MNHFIQRLFHAYNAIPNKSNDKFIIAQWVIHTRRTIMWSTQTTLTNKSFNFMIILRFKCLIYAYRDNKNYYHIMIIDLCDWYITLSILLHITITHKVVSGWEMAYTNLLKTMRLVVCQRSGHIANYSIVQSRHLRTVINKPHQ